MREKLFKNIGRIYGTGLGEDLYIENTDLIIFDEQIFYIGKEGESQLEGEEFEVIDVKGKAIIPGFIDCHTHFVFSGNRWKEFYLRFQGKSYLDIQKEGGGIHFTVQQVRKSSKEELLMNSLFFLEQAFRQGTTTVEIKTGYGLDFESEKKLLEVINELKQHHPIEIIPTFLGAHVCPKEMDKDLYMKVLLNEMLPAFREYSERCDIFIEDGAFSVSDAESYFSKALDLGYDLCAHMNQIHDLGGINLIHDFPLVSIDHLELLSDEHAALMADKNVTGVFLPIAEHFLNHSSSGEFKKLKKNHGICALSTDFNPGSAPVFSFPLLMLFAVSRYGLDFQELFESCFLNAAKALKLDKKLGSLEPGKQADFLILNIQEAEMIPYMAGAHFINTIVKKGCLFSSSRCCDI